MDKGELHESILTIERGKKFPFINDVYKIHDPDFGLCNVQIIAIGRYEWLDNGSVETTITYTILDVIEPSQKYRIRQSGLKLIKDIKNKKE